MFARRSAERFLLHFAISGSRVSPPNRRTCLPARQTVASPIHLTLQSVPVRLHV